MICLPSYSNLLLSTTDLNLHVLGEWKLLQNEFLAELSNAADAGGSPKFLHIINKQADIESLYFDSSSMHTAGPQGGGVSQEQSAGKAVKEADAKGGPKILHGCEAG